MSPKKKTKLHRAKKHRPNKTNLKKNNDRVWSVSQTLRELEQETSAE